MYVFSYASVINLSCCLLVQETPDEGWHELVSKGYIEYIDTEEEETTMISMTINVSKIYMIEQLCSSCVWRLLSILFSSYVEQPCNTPFQGIHYVASLLPSIFNFMHWHSDARKINSGPYKCETEPRGGILWDVHTVRFIRHWYLVFVLQLFPFLITTRWTTHFHNVAVLHLFSHMKSNLFHWLCSHLVIHISLLWASKPWESMSPTTS
jgi:hypothetical protein